MGRSPYAKYRPTAAAAGSWAVTASMLGEPEDALRETVAVPLPVLKALVEQAREMMGILIAASDGPPPEGDARAHRQRLFAAVVSGEKCLHAVGVGPKDGEVWIWTPPADYGQP